MLVSLKFTTAQDILEELVRLDYLPDLDALADFVLCQARGAPLDVLRPLSHYGLGNLSHIFIFRRVLGGANAADAPASLPKSQRRKKRKSKYDADNSDISVWDETDESIIHTASKSWRSKAYQHFNVEVVRYLDSDNLPDYIAFKFVCKSDPDNCHYTRGRLATSDGTSNLLECKARCDKRHGRTSDSQSTSVTPSSSQLSLDNVSDYSKARHRAIIAMRCAVHNRPYNIVSDELYDQELQLLRPTTTSPSPSTVSRDILALFREISFCVKDYFQSIPGAIHLAVNGWTSPLAFSYLGIVVIWYASGKIHRAILDFVQLYNKHVGKYLAQKIADCLKRYDLTERILSTVMDNASNCDSTAVELALLVPHFRGTMSRTRCLPHIINLIAKAIISFFFRQKKKRRAPKIPKTKGRRRGGGRSNTAASTSFDSDIESDESDADEALLEAMRSDDGHEENDDGKDEHDKEVVRTVREAALREAKECGIVISSDELDEALGLFPKVAGLARRVHDSSTLKHRFEQIIDGDPQWQGQKGALDRRVPTRWNTDFACILAHLYFEPAVIALTDLSALNLSKFRLTPSQWDLAKELQQVLLIFDDITRLFSQAEVPLVYEVLPIMAALEHALDRVKDDEEQKPVIRVAAMAGLEVLGKYYYALTEDTDIYRIAIAMCPDSKTQWFEFNLDWTEEDRNKVKDLLRTRWEESYAPPPSSITASTSSATEPSREKKRGKYSQPLLDRRSHMHVIAPEVDSIEAYLTDSLVPTVELDAAGGVLAWWEQQRTRRPRLAQMALDYLSAPASSVDAERAFSNGRLQCNYLQHGLSSNSFRAKVALGSWYKTPLMPDLSLATACIQQVMSGCKHDSLRHDTIVVYLI